MSLSAVDRLGLWDAGSGESPAVRDLALLGAGHPGVERETLRGLAIGHRDALLLAMYKASFGARMGGVFDCASCGETLEVTVDVAELLGERGAGSEDASTDRWTSLEVDGYQVMFRVPDSEDLDAVVDLGRRAHDALADRVVRATRNGRPEPVDSLPARVLDAALHAMAAADPLAETVIAANCLSCAAPCRVLLDVGAFLWAHVRVDAHRLLSEVDILARAYGWTEAEILALGERRRAAYLELAR